MNNLLPQVLPVGGSSGIDRPGVDDVESGSNGTYLNPFGNAGSESAQTMEHMQSSRQAATAITIEEEEEDSGGREDEEEDDERRQKKAATTTTTTTGAKKKRQWVPDNDMVEFFKSITLIDEYMRNMEEEVVALEALHMKSKITTNITIVKEMRESMADHISSASRTSKQILNTFSEIENTRKAKLSALSQQKLRMRTTIFTAKRKQFKKLMSKFSSLRSTVQADYKEIVFRRYMTVTGEALSDEGVTRLIETGESETIFQKAILEQGRGQIQDTINEIDERHRSMQEIERGLLELQQVFIDLATVVDQQSEVLDSIESHMNTASEFTSEGTKALQVTAGLHKSIQRKRLCIAILVVCGCLILLAIIWPVVDRSLQTASAQANARAARAATARDRAEQIINNDNSGNNSSQP
jgi:syntaxin 1B/2/3